MITNELKLILDAASGNRIMWLCKNPHDFVFIDLEEKLQVKPTIICNNECTPFCDGIFDTIFYDPPHIWRNSKTLSMFTIPNKDMFNKRFPKYAAERAPRYYGWDKFKTREDLLQHLAKTTKELARILKNDGLFFVKWCEIKISLQEVRDILASDFNELMLLPIKSRMQTSQNQTYWLILQKKLVNQ
jgi:hypothetical protein